MHFKYYNFITAILLLNFVGVAQQSSAQWLNNGADVIVSQNALVTVNTDLIHEKGKIYSDGWIGVAGNWYNQGQNNVFDPAGKGTVEFFGKDQQIAGISGTAFYNLWLSGSGIKSLKVNQVVNGELDLADRELFLESNNIHVVNDAQNAIKRSTGFVSSGYEPGSLVRKMKPGEEYLFPTGSSKAAQMYRPVVIKATESTNSFSAALLVRNVESDGLSEATMSKKNGLFDINHKYYHKLEQLEGTKPAEVEVLFDPRKDGDFKELAYWNNFSWMPSRSLALNGNYGDNLIKKTSKQSMIMQGIKYYVLANQNADDLFIPTSFSPNGDGKNDTWVISGIDKYPDNQVRITNRWGEELYNIRSYNSSNAWDGKNLNEGTYYYFVSVNIEGQMKTFAGYFTLLR